MIGLNDDRRMIRPAWRTVAKNALRMISRVTACSPLGVLTSGSR